jgi:hypothetical protein
MAILYHGVFRPPESLVLDGISSLRHFTLIAGCSDQRCRTSTFYQPVEKLDVFLDINPICPTIGGASH